MTAKEIRDWLDKLPPDTQVCIDDGGLALVAIVDRTLTGAYIEVGGIPQNVACLEVKPI